MARRSALKLLFVGWDGADWELVRRWVDEGALPCLASLRAWGCLCRLESVRPTITPPAWTSLYTGKNPGKHGVFAFHRLWPEDGRLVFAPPSRAVTVFRLLEAGGLRTGVLNMPWTYPPEPLDGFMISGFGAPSPERPPAHPPQAADLLLSAAPSFEMYPTPVGPDHRLNAAAIDAQAELLAAAAPALVRRFDCDALFCATMLPDTVQHTFFGRRTAETMDGRRIDDAIAYTYRQLDAALAHLIEEVCDDQTLIVVASDHGGKPARRIVNLEQAFIRAGYLVRRPRPGAAGGSGLLRALARPALAAWRAAKKLLPERLVQRLRGTARRARKAFADAYEAMEVDWSRTIAAPWSCAGIVRLNVRGRDPMGIVEPERYEAVRAEIAEFLAGITDPDTGKPVFSRVWMQEELFSGPYASEGPDLIVEPVNHDYVMPTARHIDRMPLLEIQPRTVAGLETPWGVHAPGGLLAMAGPGVKPGATTDAARIVDVAPTILALLGQGVPEDMDGRVLEEAVVDEVASRARIVPPPSLPAPADGRPGGYTADELAEINRRLEELGYL